MSGCPGAYDFVDGDSGDGAIVRMSAYRDHPPTQRQRKPPVEAGTRASPAAALTRAEVIGRSSDDGATAASAWVSNTVLPVYLPVLGVTVVKDEHTDGGTWRGASHPPGQHRPATSPRWRSSVLRRYRRTSGRDSPTSTAGTLLIGDNRAEVVADSARSDWGSVARPWRLHNQLQVRMNGRLAFRGCV